MTEETAGVDSQPACLDGLTDDYEYLHRELPEVLHKDKMVLYVPGLRNLQVEWVLRPAQKMPD